MDMDEQDIGPDDLIDDGDPQDYSPDDDEELRQMEAAIHAEQSKSEDEPTELPQITEDAPADVEEDKADVTEIDAKDEGPDQDEPESKSEDGDWLVPGRHRTLEDVQAHIKEQDSFIGHLKQDNADLRRQASPAETGKPAEELTEEQATARLMDFVGNPDGVIRDAIQDYINVLQENAYPEALDQAAKNFLSKNPDMVPYEAEAAQIVEQKGLASLYKRTKDPVTGQERYTRYRPDAVVEDAFAHVSRTHAQDTIQSAVDKGMKAGEVAAHKKAAAALVGGTDAAPPPTREKTLAEVQAMSPEEAMAYVESIRKTVDR